MSAFPNVEEGEGEGRRGERSVQEEEVERLSTRLKTCLVRLGLTPFSASVAVEYLKSQLAREGGADRMARVSAFLLSQLNNMNGASSSSSGSSSSSKNWQAGCPNIIPGLRALPFWDTDAHAHELPWVAVLEAAYKDIKEELLSLRGTPAFQPYRSPAPSTSSFSSSSSSSSSSS